VARVELERPRIQLDLSDLKLPEGEKKEPRKKGARCEIDEALQRFALDKTRPVHLYVSSDGGYVDAGLTILDQMLMMPCPMATIITGRAYSMGAVIAAYGTPGHRFITPHASIMLHPILFGMGEDYVDQQKLATEFSHRNYDRLIESLAKRIKMSKKRLRGMVDKGLWLTPAEAIDLGLADHLWTAANEAEINKLATGARKASGGKLQQLSRVLHVLANGIDEGEDFEVERQP
jgi:ATP-dependent Clp protease protease subunit